MTDNIPVTELTEGTLDGGGVFDSLMRSFKAHIDEEFKNRRITGPEYSQVYLGGVQSAMAQSVQFLLGAEQAYQQAELLKAQVATQEEQTSLVAAQTLNTAAERAGIESRTALTDAQVLNVPKEGLNIEARTEQAETQTANLLKEGESLDIRNQMSEKEALHLYGDETQTGLTELQRDKATKDLDLADSSIAKSQKEELLIDGQVSKLAKDEDMVDAQILNLGSENSRIEAQVDQIQAELLNIPKQGELLDQQVLNLTEEVKRTTAQTSQITAETANVSKQGELLDQQVLNLIEEVKRTGAQADLTLEQVASEVMRNKAGGLLELQINAQQNENAKVQAETQNIASQKLAIEAGTAQTEQQTLNLAEELANLTQRNSMLAKEEEHLYGDGINPGYNDLLRDKATADVTITEQQAENLEAELASIVAKGELTEKQVLQVVQETVNATAQKDLIDAQVSKTIADSNLTDQNVLNAVTQETVLKATECKLKAEFDLLAEQRNKSIAETSILTQKKITEQAQTSAANVDEDSVIGRQKALYAAQMNGYKRDAEQKMAKILVDTWNVRRTTDEGTKANTTNKLDDDTVGQAISTLLSGVGSPT